MGLCLSITVRRGEAVTPLTTKLARLMSEVESKVTVRPDPLVEDRLRAEDVLKVAHKDALKDSHDAGNGADGGRSPPGLVG